MSDQVFYRCKICKDLLHSTDLRNDGRDAIACVKAYEHWKLEHGVLLQSLFIAQFLSIISTKP
jgi:hypothetical protein